MYQKDEISSLSIKWAELINSIRIRVDHHLAVQGTIQLWLAPANPLALPQLVVSCDACYNRLYFGRLNQYELRNYPLGTVQYDLLVSIYISFAFHPSAYPNSLSLSVLVCLTRSSNLTSSTASFFDTLEGFVAIQAL